MIEFTVDQAKKFIGKKVEVLGWIISIRSSGSIAFLQVRDGTGFIQGTVVKADVSPKTFERAKSLSLETSVKITGLLKEEKRSPTGFEITVSDIEIIGTSVDYPIANKDHGPDFLLSLRHLWLRSKRQWAIQRIRNEIIYAIYDFFKKGGFIKIDSPILTPNACEGTTTLFPVPYLPDWEGVDGDNWKKILTGNKILDLEKYPFCYLSQSGQLYLEAAIMSHRRVFDFGPTFRAEKSKTRRHLIEFWMMDAEAAFMTHGDNMKVQEELIVAIVKRVIEDCHQELKMIGRDIAPLQPLLSGNFPVISHKEATQILKKKGQEIGERDDFGAEHETVLSNGYNTPVFIEKYPHEVKAFYMKRDQKEPSRVLNNDLLAPEGYGEIIGGSQREDDYNLLLGRMKELKMPIDDFQWYLDLRKYGSVPHSGFGIGLERIVAWICKLEHVRETIPFPRMMERYKP